MLGARQALYQTEPCLQAHMSKHGWCLAYWQATPVTAGWLPKMDCGSTQRKSKWSMGKLAWNPSRSGREAESLGNWLPELIIPCCFLEKVYRLCLTMNSLEEFGNVVCLFSTLPHLTAKRLFGRFIYSLVLLSVSSLDHTDSGACEIVHWECWEQVTNLESASPQSHTSPGLKV